tara:strand:- start:809 stop:1417 length:609 start_codon:yes stop_codon:yes gene_type:complete
MSQALFAKITLITRYNNPTGNKNTSKYGLQGSTLGSRIPINLAQQNNKICVNSDVNRISNKPQPTVTNTSSLLRKRANSCTSGSQSSNCANTNFKLQNPLNFTASAYLNRQSTKASQCEPNPNSAYENFSNKCFTNIVDGVEIQVACEKPIVKTTTTPSTSSFLRTQYFKNNCLPPPSTGDKSISSLKIMLNKNCGGSNGGC